MADFPKTLKTALETELTKFYAGQERQPFRDYIVYNTEDISNGIPDNDKLKTTIVPILPILVLGGIVLILLVKK